jgi:hypothetical protein
LLFSPQAVPKFTALTYRFLRAIWKHHRIPEFRPKDRAVPAL